MAYDFENDPRLDPRVKALLALMPEESSTSELTNRDQMLAAANTDEARKSEALFRELAELCDVDAVVSSEGLRVETLTFDSQPDSNSINVLYIRPDTDEVLPCVVYLHGGGMTSMSCYYGNYRAWAKILAHYGVAVAMVDFRNAISPSSTPEVAPFPAGLNDCASGVRWVHASASALGVDADRIVVAGESGGGNLTLATGMKLLREGDIGIVRGLYSLCPFISGEGPLAQYPSSSENNGIWITHNGIGAAIAYGIEAFERRDPLAWPRFAEADDVRGLPPVVISVNECDPLRDEGIEFYRFLMASGVPARCRQMMGTMHATEVIPLLCPDVTHDTARDLAGFARS